MPKRPDAISRSFVNMNAKVTVKVEARRRQHPLHGQRSWQSARMIREWSDGFTLPELLVVLGIIGVLLAAGMPNFRSYLQNQQVATAANRFLLALNLARSQAIQRGNRVDVAPRDGLHWEKGWVVFINQNGTPPQFDASDELIYSDDDLPEGLQVATTLSDKSYPYIAYNGYGRTRNHLSALMPQWGSWQFALNGRQRVIRVTLAGRARLCNPAGDASCRFTGTASETASH